MELINILNTVSELVNSGAWNQALDLINQGSALATGEEKQLFELMNQLVTLAINLAL